MEWSVGQNQKNEAEELHLYIDELAKTGWDGGPYLKTYFISNDSNQIVALLQRDVIKQYLILNKNVQADSVEIIIEKNILSKNSYPLADSSKISTSFHSFIINNDTLVKYEKLPPKEIIKKYYEKSGRLNIEYLDLRFLLACYFFDKKIFLLNVPQMYQSVDFVRTRRFFGSKIFE